VGDLLRSGTTFIGLNEAYQEYPVSRVNPLFLDNSMHFDWVIPKLKIVIEIHGNQHFIPTAFDGDYDKAIENFGELQYRDRIKKEAALEAGYIYLEIPYKDFRLIDSDYLANLYQKAKEIQVEKPIEVQTTTQEENIAEKKKRDKIKRQEYLASDYHKKELEDAKEHRKEAYRKIKEFKRKNEGR
jgi:hypothetical protein